jgi:AAA15 family ATPase/GTPase
MNVPIVRITNLCIQNFKNVVNGSLSLENPRKEYKASIAGIYGQNGSGKTSVIEALDLLKNVLCGRSVPSEFADFINIDSEEATLSFEFRIMQESASPAVFYQFSIKSVPDTTQNAVAATHSARKVVIFNEVL